MAEASLGGNWLCVIDIERAARVKAAVDGRGPRSEFGIILIENDDERSAVLTRLLDCVQPRMAIWHYGFGHVGTKRHWLASITHHTKHKALRQFTALSHCLLKTVEHYQIAWTACDTASDILTTLDDGSEAAAWCNALTHRIFDFEDAYKARHGHAH